MNRKQYPGEEEYSLKLKSLSPEEFKEEYDSEFLDEQGRYTLSGDIQSYMKRSCLEKESKKRKEGLKLKYKVTRNDGKPTYGEEYFVLRVDRDRHPSTEDFHRKACLKALKVYADEIKDYLPQLSEDLYDFYIEPYKYTPDSKPLTELSVVVDPTVIFPFLSERAKSLYKIKMPNTVYEFVVDPKNLKGDISGKEIDELVRFACYSQYISIRIKHSQENPDLSIYVEKLSKLFSKLVDNEFLDYGLLAPISLLRGASFNLDYRGGGDDDSESFLFKIEGYDSTFSSPSTRTPAILEEGFNLGFTEQTTPLRVLETDRILHSTFIFMFVFPKLTSVVEKTREHIDKSGEKMVVPYYETNELHDYRVLNKQLGFDLFSEEGGFVDSFIVEEKQSENSIWKQIDKYLEDGNN